MGAGADACPAPGIPEIESGDAFTELSGGGMDVSGQLAERVCFRLVRGVVAERPFHTCIVPNACSMCKLLTGNLDS